MKQVRVLLPDLVRMRSHQPGRRQLERCLQVVQWAHSDAGAEQALHCYGLSRNRRNIRVRFIAQGYRKTLDATLLAAGNVFRVGAPIAEKFGQELQDGSVVEQFMADGALTNPRRSENCRNPDPETAE